MRIATLVFRNGHVFDGRTHLPGHGLAVADGRVVAVVPDDDLDAYAAPGAEVVDLAGGVVLPGFQDAHVHPVQGGVERLRCDLSGLATPDEYLAAVQAYVAAHPERPWVLGGGWAMPAFGPTGPTAAALDAVTGDRPTFLPNRDHHGAWVNTAALRLAGVDRNTPDPADGRIERDPDGRPTGTLHEGAMGLVQRHVPPTRDEEYDAGLLVAQDYLHSLGVTAWQDAILGVYAGNGDPASAYLRAVEGGRLTARVRGALWWERDARPGAGRAPPGAAYDVHGRPARRGVASRSCRTAWSRTTRRGCPRPTATAAAATRTTPGCPSSTPRCCARRSPGSTPRASRCTCTRSATGRSARRWTPSRRRARPTGRSRGRHHVAHLQVVAPRDRPRFAELDVTANLQALWAVGDAAMTEMTLPFLDEELAGWQYPFGSLARAGARLAMGSDWPVSTPDPIAALHVAVNRVEVDEPGEPFLPQEALGVAQAWAAYTSGSAHVNHLDDTGVLAPGLVADLAVLDRDPFTGHPSEVGATRVVATYVEGEPVFSG